MPFGRRRRENCKLGGFKGGFRLGEQGLAAVATRFKLFSNIVVLKKTMKQKLKCT